MSDIPPVSDTPGTVLHAPPPPAGALSTPSSRLVTVQAVNWRNVLDFTELFRGFRLAINPAKLLLALLAIMLIYAAGRLFDAAWGRQVFTSEITDFGSRTADAYRAERNQELNRRPTALAQLLRSASSYDESLTTARIDVLKESPSAAFRALKRAYRKQFDQKVQQIHDSRLVEERATAAAGTGGGGGNAKSPAEQEQSDRARAASQLLDSVTNARSVAGRGIFDAFLAYEIDQFDQLVENTLTFIRVSPIRTAGSSSDNSSGAAVSGGLLSKNPDRLWRSDTVVGCIANMTITGPRWLFTGTAPIMYRPADANTWWGWFKMLIYRGAYLACVTVFALFSLLMLAFAGASIARLSALEMAGFERPPLKDVFVFAFRRLWIFVKAPIAPFVILLVIGLVLTLGGLVGAIPFIGEILLGLLFFIFLGIAVVLMLLLLGILGGFNLFYPTIAVEGADAFDAMSRSFAYVYARPWRMIFCSVISLIYGVITFLFVSFAVYLILMLTHTFVGWGTGFFGMNHGWTSGALKLDTLWPAPQFMQLVRPINWYAMNWTEFIGALFLHFWVFFLITAIGAYVVSYYFSIHTIIYLLMRRSVDGQDIREVFVEAPTLVAPVLKEEPAAPIAKTDTGPPVESGTM